MTTVAYVKCIPLEVRPLSQKPCCQKCQIPRPENKQYDPTLRLASTFIQTEIISLRTGAVLRFSKIFDCLYTNKILNS